VIEAVADDVTEGPVSLELCLELQVGVFRVAGKRERYGFEDLLREDLVAQTTRFRGAGLQESGAEKANLHKIVEVTSLQRGILPVVSKAEQLAGTGLESLLLTEMADRRQAENRRCRAAPLGSQCGQFPKI
jgi:hypothetical protein